MKEVFRHADSALVGLYQSMLEDAGIATLDQNTAVQQSLVVGLLTAICPLPQFFPTLYVLNDEDYPEAMTILRSIKHRFTFEEDWRCTRCSEESPATFTTCWKCQCSRNPDGDLPAPIL